MPQWRVRTGEVGKNLEELLNNLEENGVVLRSLFICNDGNTMMYTVIYTERGREQIQSNSASSNPNSNPTVKNFN